MNDCPWTEGKTQIYGLEHNCEYKPSDCRLCKNCWDYTNKKYDELMNALIINESLRGITKRVK